MRTGTCIKKHFLCDTYGKRAKRRRANCSREIPFILIDWSKLLNQEDPNEAYNSFIDEYSKLF